MSIHLPSFTAWFRSLCGYVHVWISCTLRSSIRMCVCMYLVHEGKFITLSYQHSTKPTRDYNGCSVLRRYFAQLHLLRARFPPETVGQIPVDFAWWVGPLSLYLVSHPSLSLSLSHTHTHTHTHKCTYSFCILLDLSLSVSVSIYNSPPPPPPPPPPPLSIPLSLSLSPSLSLSLYPSLSLSPSLHTHIHSHTYAHSGYTHTVCTYSICM